MKISILTITMCLLLSATTHATITIFDANSVIAEGDTYDTVVVKGDGTVVDMTGGDVNTVITMNASTFNMSGGNIMIDNDNYGLVSYDSSVLNLVGGSTYYLKSYGQSRVNISGDFSILSYSRLYDSTTVNISSEFVTIQYMTFYHNSTLNLSAGSVNGIGAEDLGNNSVLNINGGTVNYMALESGAIANISGGTILSLYTWDIGPGEINIIGYSLTTAPYGGTNGEGQVNGYWNDDIAFNIALGSRSTYVHLTLYDGILPTNCVNKPISDLSGDCKVNSIDLSKMASEWLDDGTE